MELRRWVKQQVRGQLFRVLNYQDFFDYEMFDTWVNVCHQAGFSIWDLVLEMAGDRGITRFLHQVKEKHRYERRTLGHVERPRLARGGA